MKREYSLKGRNLFKKVYKKGIKLQEKGIKIFVLKLNGNFQISLKKYLSTSNSNIKIGITISKKFGKANSRNKAKRRIRSICSELLHEMNDKYCIIIRPGNKFHDVSYDEAKLVLRSLLVKAGVIE